MMNNKKKTVYRIIILALAVILGMFLGSRINFTTGPNKTFSIQFTRFDKFNEILNYIIEEYVDTITKDQVTEKAINSLLKNLDPHSAYIPSEELKAMNEPLAGNFEGIGIEFNIINDTIIVISPVSGGPSEALGIEAGDRIIKIEDELVAGTGITNKEVINRLRGSSGSEVNISISRKGSAALIYYTITRGKIPIESIDFSYMVNDSIGYIKISRFSATTYDEYLKHFSQLHDKGLSALILDLRGNPGGYLSAAIALADEFLENGKLIVYTKGKTNNTSYFATDQGNFLNGRLVVLIDEGSASASEIIAGAVQDNDRGLIIRRRSFGKGMVQEQFEFTDGSALRLTIARYYTPTGRCIQKSYSKGTDKYYYDIFKDIENGTEKQGRNKDSIYFADSLSFTTPGGKIVYGGGGIMPDIYVPFDTTGLSTYLTELVSKGIIDQFAFDYTDKNRKSLNEHKNFPVFNEKFTIDDKIFYEFISYAENKGVKRDDKGLKISKNIILFQLKALIARHIFNSKGYYPVIHNIDNTFQKALEIMNDE